jgi:peroxiredoxin
MAIYCTEAERHNYEETGYWRALPKLVPSMVFPTRSLGGWKEVTTWDMFAKRRVLIFSLPGAFTPTCSNLQLPTFEQMADDIYCEGIDDIYCITVNDAFVCNAWAEEHNLTEVVVIPDGNARFTEEMQMVVDKDNLGFGRRSWRYAAVVENGRITDWFIEEGKEDNHEKDPYVFTDPEFILRKLRESN